MRQRNLRSKEQINEENKEYIVEKPVEMKGHWQDLFSKKQDLYIEIGSGKGAFLTKMAQLHPDRNYLACEGAVNIYPRILQKLGELKLDNLKVITEYIIDPGDYFERGELSGVYLNFSDPWPKDRHAHRRLTHVKKLLQYKEILTNGASLEFKTDNNPLFDFSLEQVELAGLFLNALSRDLHNSEYAADNVETEYEHKFAEEGRKINYLKIKFD